MNIALLQPDGLVTSPAFSHVAIVPAGARTIYVGGQNGIDSDGTVVSGDVAEQAARAVDRGKGGADFVEPRFGRRDPMDRSDRH
jgi:hypothetical protein